GELLRADHAAAEVPEPLADVALDPEGLEVELRDQAQELCALRDRRVVPRSGIHRGTDERADAADLARQHRAGVYLRDLPVHRAQAAPQVLQRAVPVGDLDAVNVDEGKLAAHRLALYVLASMPTAPATATPVLGFG